ncbi:MAG TPA: response regulator, partial [Ktedonobacterales bacterium]|nr:response regulator [Ktedonobacterales bacterium]
AIRDTLREALEDEGYRVDEAADGIAGLEILRASGENMVVLLDQLMPKLDGVGVLRAVQSDPLLAHRHTYILLTARSRMSTPVTDLATELGVPIIRKPFDLDTLFQAIVEAIARLEGNHT